jgi:hypothetical protein
MNEWILPSEEEGSVESFAFGLGSGCAGGSGAMGRNAESCLKSTRNQEAEDLQGE